jgi:hypothetical protein
VDCRARGTAFRTVAQPPAARVLLYAYRRRLRGVVEVAPSWVTEETLSASVPFRQAAAFSLCRRSRGLGDSGCTIGAQKQILYTHRLDDQKQSKGSGSHGKEVTSD